jgi:hypothetical protein
MGVRAAQERHVQQAGQLEIVDVVSLSGDEPRVLTALDR